MKLRFVMIDADDLSAGDVAEVLTRAIPAPLAPAPVPEPASLPAPATAPSTSTLPDPSVRDMAPIPPTWRPRAKRQPPENPARRERRTSPERVACDPRPTSPEMVQCRDCGESLPPGKDRRARCLKCGAHAWETIPARSETPTVLT